MQNVLKTLLVNHDSNSRLVCDSALQKRGHEVTSHATAEEAWEACQRQPYELAIVDWMLPGMDGLDLCRRIRGLPWGNQAVILVATGRDRPEDLRQILEARADDFLVEPFSVELLNLRLTIAERLLASRIKREPSEGDRRRSEASRKTLFRAVPDALFVHEVSADGSLGCFTDVNDEACRRLGYTREELLGMSPLDIDAPESDVDTLAIAKSLAQGKSLTFEQVHVAKDGHRVPVEIHATAFSLEGQPAALSVVRDVTERKRLEETLRGNERRYRDLVEHASIAIMIDDENGNLCYCNGQFAAMFGYSLEEIRAQSHDTLVHSADLERVRSIHRARIAGETVPSRYEFLGVKKDRSRIWLEVDAVLLEEDGRVVGTRSYLHDVTERKQLEERLNEAHSNFVSIVEKNADGLMVVDGDGVVRFANPAARRLLQRSRLEGSSFEVPASAEIEVVREDGTPGIAELQAVETEWQEERALLVSLRDITERVSAEQTIRESEARFRTLFEQSPIAIEIYDREGRLLSVNPACAAMFGLLDPSEAQGFSLFDDPNLPGGVAERLSAGETVAYEATFDFERVRRLEPYRTTRSGAMDIQVLITPLGPEAGSMAGGCMAQIQDISERRHAEEALRASEARYRTLFERNLAGVYRSTLEGDLLECNDAFSRIFGYESAKQVLQRRAVDLYVEPDDRRSTVAKLSDSGKLVSDEVACLKRDGSTVWCLENATLVPDETGALTMIEGTLIDVTERRRLEDNLRQAQKMEAVGRLAGGVAHDFNNLLQALLSTTEVLKLHPECPHSFAKRLTELEENIARGASLSRQLLIFSRRQTTKVVRLDLNGVVGNTLTLLKRLLPEHIKLHVHLADETLPVDGDRGQLEQVLVNLAVNAADAMSTGGELTITTGEQGGDRVLLSVEDTGQGMADEIRDRIFEPFFTTKDALHGTGLGLSVVHGIVTQHGGRIEVETEVGQGTTFRVALPRSESPEPEETRDPVATAGTTSGGRVLVVEDEPAARKALKAALKALGFEAVAVGNVSAVEPFLQERFDVVLTDLVLPDGSGAELAQRLQERWPATAVVLMSGHAEDELIRRGISSGDVAFLQKPFGLATLREELQKVVCANG